VDHPKEMVKISNLIVITCKVQLFLLQELAQLLNLVVKIVLLVQLTIKVKEIIQMDQIPEVVTTIIKAHNLKPFPITLTNLINNRYKVQTNH
jgi:hypothetical protein